MIREQRRGTPRTHSRTLGVVLLLFATAFPGCVWLSGNRTEIYDVSDAPLHRSGTIEQVGERIRRAAEMQGWDVQEVQPRVLYVTKRRGQHAATAAVSYDVDAFSIRIRSSENLKQGDNRIHKLYNEWIQSLESTIQLEVDTGS